MFARVTDIEERSFKKVKICGLRHEADTSIANEPPPAYLCLVFAESVYTPSEGRYKERYERTLQREFA
ncbi:MAG: hypothetical protein LBB61_07165 [Treponema sp.]|nr:hypothetical protein [Treponema sp.]